MLALFSFGVINKSSILLVDHPGATTFNKKLNFLVKKDPELERVDLSDTVYICSAGLDFTLIFMR